MNDLELQIQRIRTSIAQVSSIRASLASYPHLTKPIWEAEKLLADYHNLLKSQLQTQDSTDPAWHDT